MGNAFTEGATLPLIVPSLPNLQRVYFKLGKPIRAELMRTRAISLFPDDPRHQKVEPTDAEIRALRDEVRDAINKEVNWLLEYRNTDPHRYSDAARAAQALHQGLMKLVTPSKL